jgi:hypothetical protein
MEAGPEARVISAGLSWTNRLSRERGEIAGRKVRDLLSLRRGAN